MHRVTLTMHRTKGLLDYRVTDYWTNGLSDYWANGLGLGVAVVR